MEKGTNYYDLLEYSKTREENPKCIRCSCSLFVTSLSSHRNIIIET